MNEETAIQRADETKVRDLLRELSRLLLSSSWDGIVGYENTVEKVGRAFGYPDTCVMMEAQSATIRLDEEGPNTFVKGGIPGLPPLAFTQDLKNLVQARKPRSIPAFVLMIPVIFALSPGSHGLRQMETWISGETITGIENLETMFTILLAIAMGMVVGSAIAHRWVWTEKS